MTGFRFGWLVGLVSLCFVALCAFTAVSLLHQQTRITLVLRENVSSRRAAADLRGVLNTLIELETNHVERVADPHARAQAHLHDIRRHADQAEEQALAARLEAGFAAYLKQWQSLPPPTDPRHEAAVDDATRFLQASVLAPCRDIEAYNDQRIEETTAQHELFLRRLAWGMAVVGGLGGGAGLAVGYGAAYVVNRSLRQLRVQVRSAAGKIDPDLPEIVLTGEGGFVGLSEEINQLTGRIERVVQELQQREREVLRAEQLAAVGQLAAGVGHEIRNPLTSIKMLVQAGLEDGDRAGLTPEDMRIIEGEVRRMERSLQTFLDFARPPKPERQPVDLLGVVNAVLGLTRGRSEKQRVAIRLTVPGSPVTLTADADQLQQVLVNVVLNALDAMPAGGTLSLAVRAAGRRVEIAVSDTGPGIPREMMPKLFTPFASSKDTGLGLGLSISRRIVEDHGGTIDAANRPGGGASVFVSLPADPAKIDK